MYDFQFICLISNLLQDYTKINLLRTMGTRRMLWFMSVDFEDGIFLYQLNIQLTFCIISFNFLALSNVC